ncbi:MAG: hypothetical protein J6T41_03325 [Neisseriaceae bacterium]|nr:hypothetical protein [Neisseriaceae bacterium]
MSNNKQSKKLTFIKESFDSPIRRLPQNHKPTPQTPNSGNDKLQQTTNNAEKQ